MNIILWVGAFLCLPIGVTIFGYITKKRSKAISKPKTTARHIWVVCGIEFPSYYIARRYALDRNIDPSYIQIKGDK